jgi:pyridoxamine 5'-phosphate oxidase
MSDVTGTASGAVTLSGDESIELPEFDAPPADPFTALGRWLEVAVRYKVREPGAVALATADADGRVSNRIVLLKEIADGTLIFTTHAESRKGRELAANPWASVTFYWRETLQQINVSGRVEQLSAQRSDELFAERPLAARVATAASRQSEPLEDEDLLHERARTLFASRTALVRPAGWAGYRLVPETVEFWQGRANRLHRRLAYTRTPDGWTSTRLQP